LGSGIGLTCRGSAPNDLAPYNARMFRCLLVLGLGLLLSSSVSGQSLDGTADVAAFMDGAVPALLAADDAEGMTVSVVKNGEILLARGYGIARSESRQPVVADRTLFRVGSVSKIFLATALMQLVEQGKLDLDTDLNVYLEGVEIPATYPEPITLRHVMTHTAGFEDSIRDVFVSQSDDRPLKEVLAGYLPTRVRPPGQLIAYSNHATALGGLVLEQISGEKYEDYIQAHILEPLGMTHTSARQPLPESLSLDVSTGPRPDDFFARVAISPAGSVSSTSVDMAKFMIAHLQLGRFRDVRILEEATARRMQTRLVTLDPRVNGLAHQFFESDLGGVRAIGHSGGMVTHFTAMTLFPEHGVGFFASVNSPSAAPFILERLFRERYFPTMRSADPVAMEGAGERLPRFLGWYRESRSGVHNFFKTGDFLSMKQATMTEGPQLLFLDEEWVETEPLVFRQVGGPDWLVFHEDDEGRVQSALRGLKGSSVLLKQPWWKGLTFHQILAGVFDVLLIWPLFHRPVWRTRRWWREARAGGLLGVSRWLAAAVRMSGLLFLVCFGIGTAVLSQTLGAEVHPALLVALALPIQLGPLSLAMLVAWGAMLQRGAGTLRARLGLAGLVAGGLGLTWWANYWNVLLTRL
jgi:CubicO group peptidase (beta-lactamase class C family)